MKHFANAGTHDAVSFVGTGVIAKAMARATANVHSFKSGFAYGLDFDQVRSSAHPSVRPSVTQLLSFFS